VPVSKRCFHLSRNQLCHAAIFGLSLKNNRSIKILCGLSHAEIGAQSYQVCNAFGQVSGLLTVDSIAFSRAVLHCTLQRRASSGLTPILEPRNRGCGEAQQRRSRWWIKLRTAGKLEWSLIAPHMLGVKSMLQSSCCKPGTDGILARGLAMA
jgi:hypothetical protein